MLVFLSFQLSRTSDLRVTFVDKYSIIFIFYILLCLGGTRWRSWLRHGAANQKVVASIPDGVIGIFH
jgi:hypothetical protein